ncbi:hypothetical protein JCM10207_003163 [Rhodosporidiobolus poonsookiae]
MPGLVKEPQYITLNSGGVEGRRRIVDEGEDGWVPTFESIPTISFRNINGTDEERAALAKEVGQACSDVSFFHVMDSPLPPNIVSFSSPACRGYEPFFETKMGTDMKGNLRESFSMGDDFLDEESQYGPEAITGMRTLHYPSQEPDGSTPGLGTHSNFSSFTLVCQEPNLKPGLEVLNLNGRWVSVPPLPGCKYVVNMGDFLKQMAGGVFKSTIHRVYNRTGSWRYSLPFFFSLAPSATIQPLPQFASNAKATMTDMHVGTHFVRRVLNSRKFHPSAVKLREKGVPMEQWRYEMMVGVGIPGDEEKVQA